MCYRAMLFGFLFIGIGIFEEDAGEEDFFRRIIW
jgi:hypothetical protein